MSKMKINKVGELAIEVPGATRIFEQLGIDYCCGGSRTLADACERLGVPVGEVVNRLETAAHAVSPGDKVRDWEAESLASLTAYIVDTHHTYTKKELVRLENLLDKVCSRHGENHPELIDLRIVFKYLKQDLLPHMLEEEQILFPFIKQMEEAMSSDRTVHIPFFVTVQNPVRMMMTDHDSVGVLLSQMRETTNGYLVPPDGCASYQTLYQSLREFESDLHQHLHLENNLLFPRVVAVESALEPAWAIAGYEFSQDRCLGH
jgi:regulator of cell morphogenesis and NO signaling